jgi:hypothetical protein
VNSRARRAQARADGRRAANTRRELAEKERRKKRHKIKNEEETMAHWSFEAAIEYANRQAQLSGHRYRVYKSDVTVGWWVTARATSTRRP